MAIKNTKNKTLVLRISESIYDNFLRDRKLAYEIIQDCYEELEDLFPMEMNLGNYQLNGFTRTSKKQEGFRM